MRAHGNLNQPAVGRTSLPTAVSNGGTPLELNDVFGRDVVLQQGPRDIMTDIQTTLTSSAETTVLAAVASTYLDLTSVMVNNNSSTPVSVDFRDTTGGAIRFTIVCPANDSRGFVKSVPKKQTAVNTNWTATASAAVSGLTVSIDAVKNQ